MINRDYFCSLLPPEDPEKIARILHALATRDGLHRFEAMRLHDTALNSTVSTLRNHYGVRIDGEPITVAAYRGKGSRLVRYSIDFERDQRNAEKVLALLTQWGYRDPSAPPPPAPEPPLAA